MKNVRIENVALKIVGMGVGVVSQRMKISFYATPAIAKAVGYSHVGDALFYRTLSYDEFKALTEIGFKPFARVSFDGHFWEEWRENIDGMGITILKFNAEHFSFDGGIGNYNEIGVWYDEVLKKKCLF